MFYSFKKISSYIKDYHRIICEIGGGFGSLASKLKKSMKIYVLSLLICLKQ